MPLFEVTLAYTYYNQQCINRWNYLGTGTPAAVSRSFGLISALGGIYDEAAIPPAYPAGTLLNALVNVLGTEVDFQQITAFNVYDPTDFYQTPFVPALGGLASGEQMSPVDAYGFRSNQVRRDISRATKRFPGVLEANVNGGGIMNSLVTANLVVIANRMSAVLTYDDEGNTLSYSPCVVGKEKYDPNPSDPTKNHVAYRYYASEAAQLAKIADGIVWQPYDQIRSQVSRQYGHGR